MIKLDSITSENSKEHNEKWPCCDYNDFIDKMYLYAKDLNELQYQLLNEKREYAGIKHKNDATAYFECSNTMDDVYETIDYYNPKGDRKGLTVFEFFRP